MGRKDPGKIREARMRALTDEKRVKAPTVCFTDLEGRLAFDRMMGCPHEEGVDYPMGRTCPHCDLSRNFLS